MGFNHKTAPLEVREEVAVDPSAYGPVLAHLHALPGVYESVLLSTCNRTEVLLVTVSGPAVEEITHLLSKPDD